MKKRAEGQFKQLSKKAFAMFLAVGMVFSLFQNNFTSYAEDAYTSEPQTTEVVEDNTPETTASEPVTYSDEGNTGVDETTAVDTGISDEASEADVRDGPETIEEETQEDTSDGTGSELDSLDNNDEEDSEEAEDAEDESEEEEEEKVDETKNLADYLKPSESSIEINGTTYTFTEINNQVIEEDEVDTFTLNLAWKFENDGFPDNVGDVVTYTLPNYLSLKNSSGDLTYGAKKVGTYTVNGNTITFNYTDEDFMNAGERNCALSLDGYFDIPQSNDEEGTTTSFTFDGLGSFSLSVGNGETVRPQSSDLTNFITDATLTDHDGNKLSEPWSVEEGQDYTLSLTFKESSELGFYEPGPLTYTIPDGVNLVKDITNGTFSMTVYEADGSQVVIEGNTFTIDKATRTLSVTFNENSPNYEALKSATNATFTINFGASFSKDTKVIDFGNDVKKDVTVTEEESKVNVAAGKDNGWYDWSKGCIWYTSTITSTKDTKNIRGEDVFSGSVEALKDTSEFTIKSNKTGTLDPSRYTLTLKSDGKGFDYTIDSMQDGEIISIFYPVYVHFESEAEAQSVEIDNKFTTNCDGDVNQYDNEVTVHYSSTIYHRYFQKSSRGVTDTEDENIKRIGWTIDINNNRKVSYGGVAVHDEIDSDSQDCMYYDTSTPIALTIRGENDTLIGVQYISWDDAGLTKTYNGDKVVGWSYTLPATDNIYSYHFNYDTLVNIEGKEKSFKVKNNAHDDKGDKGSGEQEIIIDDDEFFHVDKSVESQTSDTATWKLVINVPEEGAKSLVVTDELPSTWLNGQKVYDTYVEGSFKAEGLFNGEQAEFSQTSEGSFTVEFWNEGQTGLKKNTTKGARQIVLYYTTKCNADWIAAAEFNTWYEAHTNKANVKLIDVNGDEKTDDGEATAYFTPFSLDKDSYNSYTGSDGLIVYQYMLTVRGTKGLTDEQKASFKITDTFLTQYLKYQEGSALVDGSQNGVTVKTTDTGIEFTFSDEILDKTAFYVTYNLVVKDQDAFNAMKQACMNDEHHRLYLPNTAKALEKEANEKVYYEYKQPLDKKLSGDPEEGNNFTAEFTMVINEHGLELNGGQNLTVTDELENLKLSGEPKVYYNGVESVASYTYSDGVLKFSIPDKTVVKIVYSASVVGTGTVTFKNTAWVEGYNKKVVEDSVYVHYSGGGSAWNPAINVVKQDNDDASVKLAGAEFSLWLKDKNSDSYTQVVDNETGEKLILTTDENGKFSIDNKSGYEFYGDRVYQLREEKAPKGYQKTDQTITFEVKFREALTETYQINNGSTLMVGNTKKEEEKISISGTKTWNDNDNQDGKRTTSVTVRLYANGTEVASKTVTADDNWQYTFDNLDKYDSEGNEIVYTITEDKVEEYTTEISGYDITNSYKPSETSISVTKAWDDGNNQDGVRPDSIKVQLYADGTEKGDPVTLNAENNWTYTWTKLPEKANGQVIEYTVKEVGKISGYDIQVSGDASSGYTITNTHIPETVDISGVKTWEDNDDQDGKRPTSITVNLLADGEKVDSKEVTAKDNWQYSFTNLPKYKDGKEIVYTISEDEITDYTTEITGYDIKNIHTPSETSISVTKAWDDADNQDGKRPESIQVQLYADKEAKGDPVTLNAENNWTYTWSNLPEKSKGKKIEYTVKEVGEISGYDIKVSGDASSGYTITNTHIPEKTEVSGKKTWNDSKNQDGLRPASITVNLLADGEKVDSKTVTADDNWEYSFKNLDKYKDGNLINYTITEDPVTDYTTEIDKYNIKNTHVPSETSISVTKAWDDADNQDGVRPDSIKVQLYADGKEKGDPVTLNAENNWSYTWTGLPEKANGQVIEYTVKEVGKISGYDIQVSGDASSGYTITNTHIPETTEISGVKTWNDNDNQDGKRPASITVNLLADGEKVDSKTVTAENGWKYSFTNLPKYSNGVQIVYTITEDEVTEYTTEYDGTNIKNNHTPETVSISGTKTWDDNDNQDGARTTSVKVRLYADGEEIASKEVTAKDNWQYSFTNLPKYSNGVEIVYTVTEDAVKEYSTVITGYDITNTHTPGETSVTVTKAWEDGNNQDGVRPDSIQVQLYADKEAKGDPVTLNADNSWTYTWTNLPEKAKGQAIEYTVKEVGEISGYSIEVNGNAKKGYTITNTHIPEKTEVSGKKTWNDSKNQDGKRPKSITINLLANGELVKSKTVTADDNWEYSFKNLDKYKNGKEIVYTITEDEVKDYTTEIDKYNVTNNHTPEKTSISGVKTWVDDDNQDGKRPASITVNLLADGEKVDSKTVTEADNWSYTFDNLDKYKDGKEIVYSISEDEVTDYTTEIDGTNIKNSHKSEKIDISGKKTWDDSKNQDGKRPASITVNLLADGVKVDSKTVTADDNWQYSFKNLDKYKNGKEIVYTITEDEVTEYTTEIDKYNIKNSHDTEKVDISGVKTWNDNDNQDGKRPASITINLLADGEKVDSKKVTADDNWTYSFTGLDKYKDGKEIVYTITEDEVTDYTTEIDKYNVTNNHTPETTSISGVKTWNDNDNQDGKRPASITINLLADGKKVDSKKVTADDNWTYSFTGLDKYKDGKEIVYTITEDEVTDYTTEIDKYNVTNNHTPEKTSISGVKTWNDNDNQDGKRPASITVNLLADGKKVDSKKVTANDNWSYTFDNLDKYKNGVEIVYTVTEDEVTDYTTEIDGTNIKNNHTPEKTSISGVKTWDDKDNQDGARPTSITINLLANGEKVDSKVVTEADNWSWTFDNLDKYKDGKEIVYSITEDAISDYSSEVTGYDVKNTHTPGKTSIHVTKSWIDDNDQDGMRTKSVTVHLYADGKDTGKTITLNKANNWSGSFTELDEKKDGKVIEYTVKEDVPDGYQSEVTGDATSGFVIKNTHESEKTEFTVKKVWKDNNNAGKTRPDSIQVQLYANGVAYGEAVTLTADGNWTYTWKDLAKKESGKEIKYAVKEVSKVKNYTVSVDGSTITNTLEEKESPKSPSTPSSGSRGTKTGLETNTGLYGVTIVAAGAAIVELLKKRK